MITAATGICAAVVFGMIGLGSVTSVVLIGIIYGFFAGTCTCSIRTSCLNLDLTMKAVVGLMGPLLVILTDDMSELG